jgi:hypothetical protein
VQRGHSRIESTQSSVSQAIPGLDECASSAQLRQVLRPLLHSGRAKWLRLDGLSVNPLPAHDALQASLRAFGVYGEMGTTRPSLAVLEWGSVYNGAADGLAFFPVLTGLLVAANTDVICCMPDSSSLASIVGDAQCPRLAGEKVRWISGAIPSSSSLKSLGPVLLLANGRGDGTGELLARVEHHMAAIGCEPEAELTSSLIVELIQNIQTHSGCANAAIVAVVLTRKRPPRIQVGIADDGMGLPANMITQPRHAWLGQFSDSSITEITLGQEMSGRSEGLHGGSLGGLMRTFLSRTRCTVILRTGTAHMTMSSEASTFFRKQNLSYGIGTQLLLEIGARS